MNLRLLYLVLFVSFVSIQAQTQKEKVMVANESPIYSFTMKTIDGKDQPLSAYRGRVLLLVNVASFCGYTPQYKDLQTLYEMYQQRGFSILAFPANNFGSQEPGTDGEIKKFCETNFKITFDLFSKISVGGSDQHPLYRYLTKETEFKGEVPWNFTKYLVDRNGKIVAKYISRTGPLSKEIAQKIEQLLAEK